MKSAARDLIRRELAGVKQRLRGRVVSAPALVTYDAVGVRYAHWVVAVDIGGNRVLEHVPVKMGTAGSRSYARLGSPVWLEKDGGRYQVVGPADRAITQRQIVLVNEDGGDAPILAGYAGYTFTREPFSYYKGDPAGWPTAFYNPATDATVRVWLRAYDRVLGAPANLTVVSDAEGAQLITLVDKSGHGSSPTQATAGSRPLYRRFSATGGNTNTLCTADFDGAGDRLSFPAPVVEPSPGAISVFVLLNKDAVGAGDDIALELHHWRIYSRRTAGDTWGVDQGGGVVDSGRTLGSTFVLLELVASAFDNFELFQDGISLGPYAPGGTGLALGSSALGGSATLGSHDGRICELLVLDGAVAAAKRQSIEAYFHQAMHVAYSRWSSSADGFPKVRVLDGAGHEVAL